MTDSEKIAFEKKSKIIQSVSIKDRIDTLVQIKNNFPAFDMREAIRKDFFVPTELFGNEFISEYDYSNDPASLIPTDKVLVDSATGEVAPVDVLQNATMKSKLLVGLFNVSGLNRVQDYCMHDYYPLLLSVFSVMKDLTENEVKYLSYYDAYKTHNQMVERQKRGYFYGGDEDIYSIEHIFSMAIATAYQDCGKILDSILDNTFDDTAKLFEKFDGFSVSIFPRDPVTCYIRDKINNLYRDAIAEMYHKKSTKDIEKIQQYFTETEIGKAQAEKYDCSIKFVAPDTMFLNPKLTDSEITKEISDKFNDNKHVDYAISILNEKFADGLIGIDELGDMLKKCVIENKHARDNICKKDKARIVHKALSVALFGKLSTQNNIEYSKKFSDKDHYAKFKAFVDQYKDYIFDYEWLSASVQYSSYTKGYYGTDYVSNVNGFLKLLAKYRKNDGNEDYYNSRFCSCLSKVIENNFFKSDSADEKRTTVYGRDLSSMSAGAVFYIEDALSSESAELNRSTDCYAYRFSDSGAAKRFLAYVINNFDTAFSDINPENKNKVIAAIAIESAYYNNDYYKLIKSTYVSSSRFYYGEDDKYRKYGDYALFVGKDLIPGKFDVSYYGNDGFSTLQVCKKMSLMQSLYASTVRLFETIVNGNDSAKPIEWVDKTKAQYFKEDILPVCKYVLNRPGITVYSYLKNTTVLGIDELREFMNLISFNDNYKLYDYGEMPNSLIVIPASNDMMRNVQDADMTMASLYENSNDEAKKFMKMAFLNSWSAPYYDEDIIDTVLQLDNIVNYYQHCGNKSYPNWDGSIPAMLDNKGKMINLTSSSEYIYPYSNYSDEINSNGLDTRIMGAVYKFITDEVIPFYKSHGDIDAAKANEIVSNCYDSMNSYLMINNSVFQQN